MNIWRLSFLVLASIGTALCQQSYTEVEWPLPSQTAAGTPGPWHFGEVAAVAAAANGRILVLHRGGHPVIEFDSDGKLISSWGDGMISGGKVTAIPPENRTPGGPGYTVVYGPAGCYSCGAHSIRVDTDGYIWLVDAGAHVVYKMYTNGASFFSLARREFPVQAAVTSICQLM
jgi:hypothetical protein